MGYVVFDGKAFITLGTVLVLEGLGGEVRAVEIVAQLVVQLFLGLELLLELYLLE